MVMSYINVGHLAHLNQGCGEAVGSARCGAIAKKLFSDQAKFRVEEQWRFELLDAHWDVPLNELTLDSVK